jgi:hypothetical protein
MAYNVGDTVRLTVRVKNTGGPVISVVGGYRLKGAYAPTIANEKPRITSLFGSSQPFSETLIFDCVVPTGIVGGTYEAFLSFVYPAGPPGQTKGDIILPGDAYNIEINDDPQGYWPENPPTITIG